MQWGGRGNEGGGSGPPCCQGIGKRGSSLEQGRAQAGPSSTPARPCCLPDIPPWVPEVPWVLSSAVSTRPAYRAALPGFSPPMGNPPRTTGVPLPSPPDPRLHRIGDPGVWTRCKARGARRGDTWPRAFPVLPCPAAPEAERRLPGHPGGWSRTSTPSPGGLTRFPHLFLKRHTSPPHDTPCVPLDFPPLPTVRLVSLSPFSPPPGCVSPRNRFS